MTSQNRNLVARTATALILSPLVLFVTWYGGLAFAALCAIAAAVAASELVAMLRPRLSAPELFGVAVAGAVPLVPWIGWHTSRQVSPDWFPLALASALIALAVIHLLRNGQLPEVPASISAVVLSWLYCGLLLATAVGTRLRFGFAWVVMAMAVTWGNDTLAYFAGRAFGRHPLLPTISPKKTWEGFAGGALGSVLGALLVKWLMLPRTTLWDCVALGAVGSILGPFGDLAESMLKRAAGVKDSGRIIPGHGGLLDRIDALLFVSPWIYAYAAWLTP